MADPKSVTWVTEAERDDMSWAQWPLPPRLVQAGPTPWPDPPPAWTLVTAGGSGLEVSGGSLRAEECPKTLLSGVGEARGSPTSPEPPGRWGSGFGEEPGSSPPMAVLGGQQQMSAVSVAPSENWLTLLCPWSPDWGTWPWNKNEIYQIAFLTEMTPTCTPHSAGVKRNLTSAMPGFTDTVFHEKSKPRSHSPPLADVW